MKNLQTLITISVLCLQTIFFTGNLLSQNKTTGFVFEEKNGKKIPVENANIFWNETKKGTVTDKNGKFEIEQHDKEQTLIISFIGYKSDTVVVTKHNNKSLKIKLESTISLNEVVVEERKRTSYISKLEPIHTQKLEGEELKKAACCNLSESFETNASVDVHFSDAVTGAKQIQLLGLAGRYSQIMTEKLPFIRGLSSIYGLEYIPGSWMESIQISKGSASVTNGYESITGQINVEYKKPDKGDWVYLNTLANDIGKYEGNANARIKMSEKWSTMVLAHYEKNNKINDFNNDGFLDNPLIEQINLLNRWKYKSDNFVKQFGIKIIDEERTGGQSIFDDSKPRNTENGYGVNIKSKYYEAFNKFGIIFDRPNTSIALIHSFTYFNQSSFFGLNNYDGTQKTYSANALYNSYFANTTHEYTAGISYLYDDYSENLNDTSFQRTEHVPGAFFEYTYAVPNKYTFMAGIRYDYHNIFGGFITPRFHAKYNLTPLTILRASAGKGYRTPNIIAENNYILLSSKEIKILEDIKQEEAWNFGASVNQTIPMQRRDVTVNVDFYRTSFNNQLVVDLYQDINSIFIYNLNGKSYSNSAQLEIIFEPVKRLELVTALRLSDVKITYDNVLREAPLVNKYKGLFTATYYTNLKKWQFDLTTQINGDGVLPSTSSNPVQYQRESTYPAYYIIHAQITKYYKRWNIYIGVENLTDFTQDNPIIAADNPFGKHFDSSLVWAPLIGRKFYIGLRFNMES